jgi:serine/threonine-protein phosphatase PGAM5
MYNLKSLLLNILILTSFFFLSSAFSQNSDSNKKGTRIIYLIRHGDYNQTDEQNEFIGNELTPLGIAQARLLSARLKAMPVAFSSLTSSTMTRARQTAMIIDEDFPELELKQDESICECTPPSWRKDVMAGVDTTEKGKCVENLEKAFAKYFISSPDERDRNDLIVCHGNVIRYFVTKVLKVDPMSWLQMSITNCSLTIIRIMPDGSLKLDTFSDYGHIPENLRTFTGGENEIKELVIPTSK